jgi:8-oxo-dGTP pyrophosphatase MutT (NUDIX family)
VNDATITEVDRLDGALATHDWSFDRERGAEIDAHWRASLIANPALYDGKVLMSHGLEERRSGNERLLSIDFFETRFSRLLAWRDFGWPEAGGARNCFAMAALRCADGAFLLGEMNTGHSAAGRLYFPCGTPDLSDVTADRRVDLYASLRREFMEETGLEIEEGTVAWDWRVVTQGRRVACMKLVDWPRSAAETKARARAFLAREAAPELADVHMISRRDQLAPARLPDFMASFLATLLPG